MARIGLRLAVTSTAAWALLVGVREGYDYATTSPRFEVRALLFEPTEHIDDETLRGLMALPPGTNILSLDLEAIAGRVVDHPWVSQASVVRVLPDTLDVSVTEYVPRAVLMASHPVLVDETGHPFKRLEEGERGRLPLITGVDEVMMMTNADEADSRMDRALEALSGWESKRRPRLGEIHVGSAGEVTLYTAEVGTQLLLGRGDLGQALARYDALRAAIGEDSETLAVVYLDSDQRPDRPERVVATFLPTETPKLLEDAEAEAAAKAEAAAERAAADQERTQRKKRKRRGQRSERNKSRLPKYD